MSEEEIEAIEDIKEMIELNEDNCLITTDYDFKCLQILLNLIEKQQKVIEELINIIYENNFDYNDEEECLIRKYYNFNREDYEKICCSAIECKECILKITSIGKKELLGEEE